MPPQQPPFKTIVIIGAGPIGLTTAYALHHVSSDFLLEQRPTIIEDNGASLVIYPHTLPIMHQFGLLDAILSVSGELKHHLSFTADGHIFNEGARYACVRENHGHAPIVLHRAELIQILYEGLPTTTESKIHTNEDVINILRHPNGVSVLCADSSIYPSTMIIGADGVHSRPRRIMRDIALQENPSRSWDPAQPFASPYQLLYGSFPAIWQPGQGYDVQDQDRAIILPRETSNRVWYTEEDIEALGHDFAEFPSTRTMKVKDIWPGMQGIGMTNLEEGIVRHWHLGRVVLVGDACHKMTTHLGLGFNNEVQDVVVLCNGLWRGVFEAYEEVRKSRACSLTADVGNAGLETRMHTWRNTVYYGISRLVDWLISLELRKGRVLGYILREEVMRGGMSWVYPMDTI
ncbi:FAD/NAD(P)-binding domain-containing protein [Aspergillus sclerotiicarbonarius CBS 121057]|uniref:FAD/NAD(P)-binding domain-containing protein n=1 Tax=Aspergillus sclerotiicarbonarius (strain CBS 121057 / IBT 28362) TaxID=1448318 RepID=A0A319EGF4_ASPSB|nr:FAD/NAD(P)-binding domain-containing protein [Aspergillus sclerotiicarbonarius CBS 121057]